MNDALPHDFSVKRFAHRNGLDKGRKAAMLCLDGGPQFLRRDLYSGHIFTANSASSLAIRRFRLSMRRFTRLTNGFSKKVENMKAAVSLHFAHYNFVRLHRTLRVTPAMAAGVSDRLWSLEELVERTT